ncbi:hypothetical protein M514_27834 [Trichuris suis]|uniref:Uncharacterized protein n=1 Tax=Trichuris suis TaxID=68888 RepID=A0A085MRZ0_9BILA|nr:hypothetical protein M514_27834 [Trichuris suis]
MVWFGQLPDAVVQAPGRTPAASQADDSGLLGIPRSRKIIAIPCASHENVSADFPGLPGRPDKSLHQLRTAMHHYPLNQERALDLSILTVFGTGDFTTILPPEPKHFGFPEAAQRVIKRTSPNRWLASFTVTTRAVSDRLRTSNFRS